MKQHSRDCNRSKCLSTRFGTFVAINASSETYRRNRNNFLLCFQGMIRLDFVIDAACVGLEDPIKGHLPVGFIVIDKSTRMSLLRN